MGDTLPDLDELEIDLSMLEGTAETAAAAPGKGASQAESELELDLASLGLEGAETGGAAGAVAGLARAPEAAGEAAVRAGGSASALLDNLEFDLEMADAKTTTLSKDTGVSAKSSDIDEIDISDLEDMLDDQGPALAGTAAAAVGAGDLDLDRTWTWNRKPSHRSKSRKRPTHLISACLRRTSRRPRLPDAAARDADLDRQLDLEPETGPTQAEAAAEADELDFSDISAMLEQEEKPVAAAAGESLEDVDLTIEDMPAAAGSDEDFMLDLETLLDEGHGPAPAGKPDEASEALDLDVVPAEARGSSTDLEIEFEPEADAPPVKRLPVAAAAQASVAAGRPGRRWRPPTISPPTSLPTSARAGRPVSWNPRPSPNPPPRRSPRRPNPGVRDSANHCWRCWVQWCSPWRR